MNIPIGLRAHWMLMVPVLFLLIIGFVMLLSTSSVVGYANFQDSYFFIKKHILFLCIGSVAFFLGFFIPNKVYKERVVFLYFIACILFLTIITALIYLVSLFFLSKIPIRFLIGIALIGIGFVVVNLIVHPYQMARVTSFLNPWSDPLGKNYHIIQSLTAVGSGGLTGLGIGESKLKYFYLPLQYSDFIFSIICEEGGLFLGMVVVILFGVFLYQGFRIARESMTLYGYYLAMGLMLFIVFQALINMGVVIGLMPITGIPLTFISFGGTSLVTSLFYVGVILNVSRETCLKEHEFIVKQEGPT